MSEFLDQNCENTTAELLEGIVFRESLAEGLNLHVQMKLYAQKGHYVIDQNPAEEWLEIPISDFSSDLIRKSLDRFGAINEKDAPMIGISSSLYNFHSTKLQIPMIDLEVDATGDPYKDLKEIYMRLSDGGYKGWFIQSGNPGLAMGSYHFLGRYITEKHFPSILGQNILLLTEHGNNWLLEIGEILFRNDLTDTELYTISESIKEYFPSLPSGCRRAGLLFDPRHIAHGIDNYLFSSGKRGLVLRISKGKGYDEAPFIVAELG